ncbi:hypothetical protein T484DRAFT_1848393 [Baffinella frigidus]|nr:hypothetical protein T484DRAFT_1848393 [Cryptophyta sp. CCMP2293]
MKGGSRAEIIVAPELGYGDEGREAIDGFAEGIGCIIVAPELGCGDEGREAIDGFAEVPPGAILFYELEIVNFMVKP